MYQWQTEWWKCLQGIFGTIRNLQLIYTRASAHFDREGFWRKIGGSYCEEGGTKNEKRLCHYMIIIWSNTSIIIKKSQNVCFFHGQIYDNFLYHSWQLLCYVFLLIVLETNRSVSSENLSKISPAVFKAPAYNST